MFQPDHIHQYANTADGHSNCMSRICVAASMTTSHILTIIVVHDIQSCRIKNKQFKSNSAESSSGLCSLHH